MSKWLRILGIVIIALAASGPVCAEAGTCRKGFDICGKIVDFDTGRPIEGVVVSVAWYKQVFRLVIEPGSEYYDYEETLTDKGGEFVIKGRTSHFFRKLGHPQAAIFKAGYSILHVQDLGIYLRRSFRKDLKVEWVAGRPIIHYRKQPLEKRKKYLRARPRRPLSKVPSNAARLFRAEIERAYKTAGMVPPDPNGYRQVRVVKGGVYPASARAANPNQGGQTNRPNTAIPVGSADSRD